MSFRAPETQAQLLDRRLHFLGRRLGAAQKQWDLIADGDRILLGLSGGKDSVTLLHLLPYWRRRAPRDFELGALHVEVAGAEDNVERRRQLRELGDRLEVAIDFVATDPEEIGDFRGRPAHPCFRCAWKRREALFTHAADRNFNKVALAHHLDDAAQTTLLNLLFKGDLGGMHPARSFFGGRVTLIRPLILAEEREIRRVASVLDFPFYSCLCSHEADSQRAHVKSFLNSFGPQAPTVKRHLWRASRREEPFFLGDESR